jgi:hypothetical protein
MGWNGRCAAATVAALCADVTGVRVVVAIGTNGRDPFTFAGP